MKKKVRNFYHVRVIHSILVVNQQGIQNSNAVLLSNTTNKIVHV